MPRSVGTFRSVGHGRDCSLPTAGRLEAVAENGPSSAVHHLSQDNELPFFERVVMKLYFWLKELSLSEERGFGLDPANVTIEKFPLIVSPIPNFNLKRTMEPEPL